MILGTEIRRLGKGAITLAALAISLGVSHAQHEMHREEPGIGPDPRLSPGQIAPLLEGLGEHHRPVTRHVERAQLFFDQGLRLTYAFNHAEALRAYKEAARLDPKCAMAYWGQALALGPNINLPMPDENRAPAFEAIQNAMELRGDVSPVERELIEALALRFADPKAETDQAALDAQYAEAMGRLAERYPDDDDIAVLYAASLMELNPWYYWTPDGEPRAETPTVIEQIEKVIARSPDHAGAHHYYIHAVEASLTPERAEPSADKLLTLMPSAGHMVHMPSHIYMRVGRFDDAVESNRLAIEADQSYITQCRAQGIYPLAYYPHNMHFMGWGAVESGRSRVAIEAARMMEAHVPPGNDPGEIALKQTFLATPLYTLVRFNRWDEILQEKQPGQDLVFLTSIWRYARARALAAKGELDAARAELEEMRALAADESLAGLPIGFSMAPTVLSIAENVAAGDIALAEGEHDAAIAHYETAVRLQDGMQYNEPPDWHYPVRQSLGAALLKAGRAAEAESVYWADLAKNRQNPWSLFGLAQALDAQGKDDVAAEVRGRLAGVWTQADVQPTSSVTCEIRTEVAGR
jgi:tetratricopeptide (TPR) repeat protein